jgi:diacylglycerol kinase (ATP)
LRILLIYNPTAGDDSVDPTELGSLLEAAGYQSELQSVKEEGWESALSGDFDLVVAAGGDGTVTKVFKELSGDDTPATLFPIGSANNIARSLGIAEDDPRVLVERLRDARRVWFDIGEIESKAFVESAGGGIFAEVLARADDGVDSAGGEAKLELGLRLLRDVVEDVRAFHLTVKAGHTELSDDFLAVEAMNVRELGANVPLAPGADPADGRFDLTLIREADRSPLAAYLDARLASREPVPPIFETHRVHGAVIEAPDAVSLHCDDELLEGRAGSVTIQLTSRLQVLVPRL